jgi:hypothetical protein
MTVFKDFTACVDKNIPPYPAFGARHRPALERVVMAYFISNGFALTTRFLHCWLTSRQS